MGVDKELKDIIVKMLFRLINIHRINKTDYLKIIPTDIEINTY